MYTSFFPQKVTNRVNNMIQVNEIILQRRLIHLLT
jgi:hypothetical protein